MKKLLKKLLSVILIVGALSFTTEASANDRNNRTHYAKKKKSKKKKNKKRKNKKNKKKKRNQGVPLDGGLGILALGAAVYGTKKLRDCKKDDIA